MSSSKYSDFLHLPIWEEMDKPKREDYANAFQSIEDAFVGHLNIGKTFITLGEQYVTAEYVGSAEDTQTVDLGNASPFCVMLFRKEDCELDESSMIVRSGKCLGTASNTIHSEGISLSENTLTVGVDSAQAGANLCHTNDLGTEYVVLMIKAA